MAKSPRQTKKARKPAEDETRAEINRQHKLLALDFDKKALKGNVKQEDFRHHREFKDLSQTERREYFQIRLQRNEALEELKKVRRGYTGHYDDSMSPIENIQNALRHQCMTPMRSTRLSVPNVYPLRKVRSQEALGSARPPTGSGSSSPKLGHRAHSAHFSKPPATQSPTPSRKAAKSPRPLESGKGKSVGKGDTQKQKTF